MWSATVAPSISFCNTVARLPSRRNVKAKFLRFITYRTHLIRKCQLATKECASLEIQERGEGREMNRARGGPTSLASSSRSPEIARDKRSSDRSEASRRPWRALENLPKSLMERSSWIPILGETQALRRQARARVAPPADKGNVVLDTQCFGFTA